MAWTLPEGGWWRGGTAETGRGGAAETWRGGATENWRGGATETWRGGGAADTWREGATETWRGGATETWRRGTAIKLEASSDLSAHSGRIQFCVSRFCVRHLQYEICADFILQAMNVQGLGMRLGLMSG